MVQKLSFLQNLMSRQQVNMVSITCLVAIILKISIYPSPAADPFRSQGMRKTSNNTEEAFKGIFQQGNYPLAERY